jgi:hypothetical protein
MSSRTQSRNGTKKEADKPVFSKRAWSGSGNLEIAVWERTIGEGDEARVVLNTTMKKTFKDGDDYRESNSLRAEEIGLAILMLQEAFHFISNEQNRK